MPSARAPDSVATRAAPSSVLELMSDAPWGVCARRHRGLRCGRPEPKEPPPLRGRGKTLVPRGRPAWRAGSGSAPRACGRSRVSVASTVFTLRYSRSAISRLLAPRATSAATRPSVSVSSASRPSGASRAGRPRRRWPATARRRSWRSALRRRPGPPGPRRRGGGASRAGRGPAGRDRRRPASRACGRHSPTRPAG